jgi:ParB-like chromosome segregation protein Spo0J
MTEMTAEDQRIALEKAERKGRKEVERKARELSRLDIEYVRCELIKPNPYNPNRQTEHDFELLLRSMEDDGFTVPVLCVHMTAEHMDDPIFANYRIGDIVITDGEHRWRAAMKLGFQEIPVVFSPMTPVQMRMSTLRHNRARGSEDIELSTEMLRDLELLGYKDWALDGLGMTQEEFDRLIEDVPAPEALADPEHSEAWEPDKAGGDIAPVEGRDSQHDSGQWTNASTGAAIQAARDREAALREAKTQEQKDMITKDMSAGFYRVSLLLYGEDAEAAKIVLKGAPAEAFAALIREKLEREPEMADGSWVLVDEIIGRRTIPAESAVIIAKAIEVAQAEGDVTDKNAFQLFEYLAADYLAGHGGGNGASG